MGKSNDKGVTIIDIAREAGVSIATVSRVLNRGEGAGPEVRTRVLEIVNRLGYRPNVSARALSGRRSYLIGVMFLRLGGYHYVGEVQLGAMNACRRAGYHLVVEQIETPQGVITPEALGVILRDAAFDGFVTAEYTHQSAVMLDLLGTPISRQKAFGVVNASIGVAGRDEQNYRVALFVNNLFDQSYATSLGYTGSSNAGAVAQLLPRNSRRYVGIRARMGF
jgi:outer membrane receptor protein involved in Fe transport